MLRDKFFNEQLLINEELASIYEIEIALEYAENENKTALFATQIPVSEIKYRFENTPNKAIYRKLKIVYCDFKNGVIPEIDKLF